MPALITRSMLLLLLQLLQLHAASAFRANAAYDYKFISTLTTTASSTEQQQQQQQQIVETKIDLQLMKTEFKNGMPALSISFQQIAINNQILQTMETPATIHLTMADSKSKQWIRSLFVSENRAEWQVTIAQALTELLRPRPAEEQGQRDHNLETIFGYCDERQLQTDSATVRMKELFNCCSSSNSSSGSRPPFNFNINCSANITQRFSTDAAAFDLVQSASAEEICQLGEAAVHVAGSSELQLLGQRELTPGGGEAFDSLDSFLEARRSTDGVAYVELQLPIGKQQQLEQQPAANSPKQLKEAVTVYRARLNNNNQLNPQLQAEALLQAVDVMRNSAATDSQLLKLLRNLGGQSDSDDDFLPYLLELFVACGTRNCLAASFDFVNDRLEQIDPDALIRFIVAIQQSPSVNKQLLDRTHHLLLQLQRQQQQQAAASAAAASLASIARRYKEQQQQQRLDFDTAALLLEQLRSCSTNDDCRLAALAAMENLPDGRYELELRAILLERKPSASVEARASALRVMWRSGVTRKMHDFLRNLLHGDWALEADSPELLQLLLLLGEREVAELPVARVPCDVWLALRRLWHGASLLQARTAHCALTSPTSSSSTSGGRLLRATGQGEVRYRLSMLGNAMGGVRRTNFGLSFASSAANEDVAVVVLGVRLFADAVDSLLSSSGEEAEDEQQEQEPTAGLQLQLLGETQSPIRFFSGSSGLMSAAWNAPSEPTSIMAATFVGHNLQQHRLAMLAGQTLSVSATSVGLVRVSGSLSISLWNRDALSKVETTAAGAISVSAAAVLPSPLAAEANRVTWRTTSSASTSFDTSVKFAEPPIRLCMLMQTSHLGCDRTSSCVSLGQRPDAKCGEFDFEFE